MEALIKKRIEQAAREIVELSQFLSDFPHDKESVVYGALEMAKWLLSHQWISVEEALPNYEEDVLVRNAIDDYFVTYRSEDSVDRDEYGFVNYHPVKITHWMPIPQLKGGEK